MPGFEINRFIGLDHSLAQHLSCSICLNIYDNAINCDCGHTFCKSCIQLLIDSQNRNCPECRQLMATKKRSQSLSTQPQTGVVIKGYNMIRNLKINAIICDLKIKCDFEFNGCREVIELGLLSSHLKNCEHRNCYNCGLTAGRVDEHNCVQLLKNDRNVWKQKFEESQQIINKLRRKVLRLQTKDNSEEAIEEEENQSSVNRHQNRQWVRLITYSSHTSSDSSSLSTSSSSSSEEEE